MKSYLFAVLIIGSIAALTVPSRGDEKKVDDYPLTTCVVSDETLGEMGEAFIYHHGDREVRFCCKKCLRKFLSEPDKYIAKIDAAAAKKSEVKADDDSVGHEEHDHDHQAESK